MSMNVSETFSTFQKRVNYCMLSLSGSGGNELVVGIENIEIIKVDGDSDFFSFVHEGGQLFRT